MLPQYKRSTGIGIGVGLAFQFLGQGLLGSELPGAGILVSSMLMLLGLVVFIWGCGQYAKGKGYSPWLGTLGLLSIFGLIALVVMFPDKHKPGAQLSSDIGPKKNGSYAIGVRFVALSPLLPLALYLLINGSCAILGVGMGFACTHPGDGKTFWLEIFAYAGVLGWIPSLLAAGALSLLEKFLSIGTR